MKNISKYLAGAAGFTAAIAASQADAAVTAFTFDFGTTLNSSTGSSLNTGSGFGYFASRGDPNIIVLGGYVEVAGQGLTNAGKVYASTVSFAPTFFTLGTIIGDGSNGVPNIEGFFGSITTNQSGYIGFKTGGGNFGYAEVSWNATDMVLTIGNTFVESVAGNPITIVPEPSVAGLLAIGAVAAARRRRRPAQAA